MHRRHFLRHSIAASLTAAGVSCAAERSDDPRSLHDVRPPVERAPGEPRAISRSLKFGMVNEGGTVLEKFQLLADIGYEGVELDSPSDLDLSEVLEAMDATGLVVPGVVDSVHWTDTLGDPDPEVRARGRAGLETALRDAHRLGASTVLLVPAVVNQDISYSDAYTRSQEEIRRVLPLAEELEVTIAFENVWNNFLLSPLEAARYIDEFESVHVGWYLDVGNLVIYGWPEHWIEALGPRIAKLDIKDFSRTRCDNEGRWKGFGVKIGEGDAGWQRVMAALDRIGYTGWASAEVGGGGRDRLAEVFERMTDAVQS